MRILTGMQITSPRRATLGATRALFGASLVLLAAMAVTACGPDEPRFGEHSGIIGKTLPNEVGGGGGGAGGGGVFGAPYDPNAFKPTTSLKAAHEAAGGAPTPADTLDCLSCHQENGAAGAKPFSFGGRVTSNNAPAADVDVIVVQPDGEKLGPVKSDADGFFWFAGPAVKDGARTSVRKGAAEQSMGGQLQAVTGGSCDSASCHVPGSVAGKIRI